MHRRQFVAAVAAVPVVLAGCAAPVGFNPPAGGVTGLVNGAQKYMGLNADQTAASLGSMFALAQNRLSPADFAKLGTTLPGLGDLVTRGTSIAGVSPSSITSMQALADAAGKLNVSPSQINALAGFVNNSLTSSGATSAVGLLGQAWR
jgi:hypothetical protein